MAGTAPAPFGLLVPLTMTGCTVVLVILVDLDEELPEELLEEEEKTGYVFLKMGRDDDTGIMFYSPYYDELGNYIPEQRIDPPEPEEQRITIKRRKKKK